MLRCFEVSMKKGNIENIQIASQMAFFWHVYHKISDDDEII